jgi:hypothetical protein
VTTGPSLDAPPIYRRFLAGGEDGLSPSARAFVVLALAGGGLLALAWLFGAGGDSTACLRFASNAAGAAFCAFVLAWIAARWLGRRMGLLAGFAWLTSAGVLAGRVDAWTAFAISLALGLFAVAEVAGRTARITDRAIRLAFHVAVGLALVFVGPDAAITVLAICLVAVSVSQTACSLRFLADPAGLGILAAAVTARFLIAYAAGLSASATWMPGSAAGSSPIGFLASVAWGGLPWWPLAAVAVVVGIGQGHYATPFWRLCGCWVLVPAGLAVLGVAHDAVAMAAMLPPLCVLAAAGTGWAYTRIRLMAGGRLTSQRARG